MNKVALVTGGTRGIGKAISLALKAKGLKAVANYHSRDKDAKAFTEETGIPAIKFNVADMDSVQKAVQKIAKDYGEISVLVNNAGITRDGFLHKMPAEDWHSVIATNLNSAFYLCSAVIPAMRDAGYGRVINISSINGQKGQMGQTNYSAAKAGLLGFTKALALESARKGITVNAICPGYIETDMTADIPGDVLAGIVGQIPTGRLGHAEEIASLVAYLAGSEAGFINGATLSANGAQFTG